jgi:hypothetical protein
VGRVVDLNNAVIVDRKLISEMWVLLHCLSDEHLLSGSIENFQGLQEEAADASRCIAMKMLQQNCEPSARITSCGLLPSFKEEGEVSV